jgi:type VI secretion system protein ImpA
MTSVLQEAVTLGTPSVIDIEALLAPIPGEKPTGESLQYSGLYDEIKEARRSEDNLEQGEWKREAKVADWAEVVSLSLRALSSQTKDLQVSAWLTEALVKLYGYPGLRDGLKVIRGLHEQYWDDLYPEEDEGDLEARANAISWMERQVAFLVKQIPLTASASGFSYSFNDFEQSINFNVGPDVDSTTAAERRQRAADENKITSEDWLKAKNSSPRAYYETLNADISQSWAAFEALDRVMDERFGRQTPGMGLLKQSLDQVRSLIDKVVKEKRLLEPDPVDSETVAVSGNGTYAAGPSSDGTASPAGPIRTRQDAINRLKEVAAYFRQTEPHSPVSYLVERAVKWSQMPLESWLASVIKDSTVLDSLRETLGVDTNSTEE